MESERKTEPWQTPAREGQQLTRGQQRKETEEQPEREAGRYQTSSQSPSGTLYFSSLVAHSVCLTLPSLTPSTVCLLLPAKFPFILQVSA